MKIEIYTTPTCPYCHAAKELLVSKAVSFDEIIVVDPDRRATMSARAEGRTSVPQIFIDDDHIGGCDDLYVLEHTGRLDALISAAKTPSR